MRRKPLDPVIADEIRHDRMQEAQTQNYERCLVRAREMFAMSELHGEIIDMVADYPMDATYITLHACYPDTFNENACAVRDFRAGVEHIIEKQAQMLLEDL